MIKLNDVEIKLDKYPDGTFLFKDIPPIGPKTLLNGFLSQWKKCQQLFILLNIVKIMVLKFI